MDAEADPGWGAALRGGIWGLVPLATVYRLTKRTRGVHGLTVLRTNFLSFLIGLGLVGVVVAVLAGTGSEMGSAPVAPVVGAVVAIGSAGVAAPVLLRRPLPCDGDTALASGYRRRFFLQIALAEAAALAGFMGYIASSAAWLYPLGGLFAAIGFANLAPTSRNLQRLQEELNRDGCHLSLVAALRQEPKSS